LGRGDFLQDNAAVGDKLDYTSALSFPEAALVEGKDLAGVGLRNSVDDLRPIARAAAVVIFRDRIPNGIKHPNPSVTRRAL
jgi:hypothetical protein